MQRMQRKFGKFLPREADDAQVANVIHAYNEADEMLAIVRLTYPPSRRLINGSCSSSKDPTQPPTPSFSSHSLQFSPTFSIMAQLLARSWATCKARS